MSLDIKFGTCVSCGVEESPLDKDNKCSVCGEPDNN
jgi:hypothetical protein